MQRTLTPRQITVFTALASGVTNEEAARIAGCSLATVERYKADPAFREYMARLGSETLMLTSERLVRAALTAVATLSEVAGNPDARAADRIKAADILLSRLETFDEVVNRKRHADVKEIERIRDEVRTAKLKAFREEHAALKEEFIGREATDEYQQRLSELKKKYLE